MEGRRAGQGEGESGILPTGAEEGNANTTDEVCQLTVAPSTDYQINSTRDTALGTQTATTTNTHNTNIQ